MSKTKWTVEKLQKLADSGKLVGVFEGIPDDVYRKGPGVSRSTLFDLHKKGPAYVAQSKGLDADALRIGNAFHVYVLENERFFDQYVVEPVVDKRTKEGRAIAEAFKKESEGKIILSFDEMEMIKGMALAISTNEMAQQVLSGDQTEVSVYAICPETNVLVKIRIDRVTKLKAAGSELLVITDLKSSKDASPSEFAKSFFDYGYDVQSGFYLDVYEWATGVRPDVFAHAVADKSDFWSCVYVADAEQINRGRRIYKSALIKYKQVFESKGWFDAQTIPTPRWINLDEVAS